MCVKAHDGFVEKLDYSDTATLQSSLAVPGQAKNGLTTQPSNYILGIYPRKIKTYFREEFIHEHS